MEVTASDRALGYLDAFDRAAAEIVAEVARAASDDDLERLGAAVPALERMRDALQAARTSFTETERVSE